MTSHIAITTVTTIDDKKTLIWQSQPTLGSIPQDWAIPQTNLTLLSWCGPAWVFLFGFAFLTFHVISTGTQIGKWGYKKKQKTLYLVN